MVFLRQEHDILIGYPSWTYARNCPISIADQLSPSQAVILARIVVPLQPDASPEVVRYLADLRFPAAEVARTNELAAKARLGTLTADEQREIDDYEYVGLVLERVKSAARQRLRQMPHVSPQTRTIQ
jgi:uncharacterized protein YnzC (UPF0291/DUF896 family)